MILIFDGDVSNMKNLKWADEEPEGKFKNHLHILRLENIKLFATFLINLSIYVVGNSSSVSEFTTFLTMEIPLMNQTVHHAVPDINLIEYASEKAFSINWKRFNQYILLKIVWMWVSLKRRVRRMKLYEFFVSRLRA